MKKLQVKRMKGGEVVKEIDVTGKSERDIERITMGLLRNMNTDSFFVDEVDDSRAHTISS
jgi:hypothetical protein